MHVLQWCRFSGVKDVAGRLVKMKLQLAQAPQSMHTSGSKNSVTFSGSTMNLYRLVLLGILDIL